MKLVTKYKRMTTQELKDEYRYLKKQYYAKENRRPNGKQTSEGFELYYLPMLMIKKIFEEREELAEKEAK